MISLEETNKLHNILEQQKWAGILLSVNYLVFTACY